MAIPTRFSSSSLVICCFLLIIFLCTINPSVLAARRLESGNGDFFGDQKDDQGKGGVHGSQSRPAGSAGGHSPSGGTVQMAPPTPLPSVTYQGSPGNHFVHVSSPGHEYEQVARNSSYSHETGNGNYHSRSEHHENSNYHHEEHHESVTCSSTTPGQQQCQHYP